MERFNKIDIAERQLDLALEIYLRNGDLVPVITLAGAADEILGVCLKINKMPNSLEELVNATCEIHRRLFGEPLSKKDAIKRANTAKNHFKHLNNEDDLEIVLDLADEAQDILDRAINNFWRLKGDLSEKMLSFKAQINSKG